MKTIGIVGANGFIGSYLYSQLGSDNNRVYGTKYSSSKKKDELIQFDITASPWPFENHIDVLIIASHIGSIDDCKLKQAQTYATNVTGVIRLLQEAEKRQTKPVYLSSNMVFAGQRQDYREDDPYSTLTKYGKQKVEVETYIKQNFPRHIITRLTKVYSANNSDKSFLADWVTTWKTGKPVPAISDMVISPVLVNDVAKIISHLIKNEMSGVMHIGGPQDASVFDFAQLCAQQLGVNESLVIQKKRSDFSFVEPRPAWQTLNTDALADVISWPLVALPDAFTHLQAGSTLSI